MNKPVLGLLLGAVLGAFDGLDRPGLRARDRAADHGHRHRLDLQGPDRRRPRRLVRLARAVARERAARRPRRRRRSSRS